MHYLTSLVLIETSRARGAAIDAELRRGYSTERGGPARFRRPSRLGRKTR
jgi:hypothetical protein